MVWSDAGTVVQFLVVLQINPKTQDLALAVTSDGNIDQLGDGDDGDLSVQDDAEKLVSNGFDDDYDMVHFIWAILHGPFDIAHRK